MGAPVEGAGMGGCRRQEIGDIIQVKGTGGDTIWVIDVVNFSTHWEDAGLVSPKGDLATDEVADETAGGWDMVVPTSVNIYGGSGIGGGGYLRITSP